MNIQTKAVGINISAAIAGAMAMAAWMADHKVDLYAIWDQLNVVIQGITKLITMASPLALAGYVAWQTTLKNRLTSIAAEPTVKGVVTTSTMADSIPSNKVVATGAEIPPGGG